jgi:catechol 2,3-dioxygenase-like lactoylglutathione lyase family enzyme
MMLHMLDHICLNVSDYDASREFFSQALAPLGYRVVMEPVPKVGGFAPPDHPSVPFWIAEGRGTVTVSHVAFTADDRATVDAFHAAALAAGGTDNGAPGVREIYHPHYYGAYVLTPDGVNLEAVCHKPEG